MIPLEIEHGGFGFGGYSSQFQKTTPPSVADIFKKAQEDQRRQIDKHVPSIKRLKEIVTEVREELDTTEIGFEIGSPSLLRALGVGNAQAYETYGVMTVKETKFLLRMGENHTAYIHLRNLMGTHDIDAEECFRNTGFQTLLLNQSSSVQKLKEVIAKALGQLTALEDLNQYNLPAVKPSGTVGKKPITNTIIG
jgi:hypothetical protein